MVVLWKRKKKFVSGSTDEEDGLVKEWRQLGLLRLHQSPMLFHVLRSSDTQEKQVTGLPNFVKLANDQETL